jgi:hypothetical protein
MTRKKNAPPQSILAAGDALSAAMARARASETVIKAIRRDAKTYETFYDFDGSNGELWTVTINARGERKCSCPARTICKHQGMVQIHLLAELDRKTAEMEAAQEARDAAILARPMDCSGPFVFLGVAR